MKRNLDSELSLQLPGDPPDRPHLRLNLLSDRSQPIPQHLVLAVLLELLSYFSAHGDRHERSVSGFT